MTKHFTLENVLLKTRSNRQNSPSSRIPSKENLKMILHYSLALEVLKTNTTGNCFLILN
ncbi:MAG: hypothetical protein IPH84_00940 [Bacteroidales bacterium]|nr:hypothetical protein [Bacteroidales bacterium]